MAGIPDGLSRFGDKLVLAACVGGSLWLISLDDTTRIETGVRWAHRLSTPVEWATQWGSDLTRLKSENEQLRTRLAALDLDARHIANERVRIEELERRAGFYETHRGRLLPATVLELVVSRIPVQAKIKSFGADSLAVALY